MKQKNRTIITAPVIADDHDPDAILTIRLGDKICFGSMVITGGQVFVGGVKIIKGTGRPGARLFSAPLVEEEAPQEEPRQAEPVPHATLPDGAGEPRLDPDEVPPDDSTDAQLGAWLADQWYAIAWAERQLAR